MHRLSNYIDTYISNFQGFQVLDVAVLRTQCVCVCEFNYMYTYTVKIHDVI